MNSKTEIRDNRKIKIRSSGIRLAITAVSLILIVVMAIGISLSWFSTEKEVLNSSLTMGELDIDLTFYRYTIDKENGKITDQVVQNGTYTEGVLDKGLTWQTDTQGATYIKAVNNGNIDAKIYMKMLLNGSSDFTEYGYNYIYICFTDITKYVETEGGIENYAIQYDPVKGETIVQNGHTLGQYLTSSYLVGDEIIEKRSEDNKPTVKYYRMDYCSWGITTEFLEELNGGAISNLTATFYIKQGNYTDNTSVSGEEIKVDNANSFIQATRVAENGDTIVLSADVELPENTNITLYNRVNLNLNGYKLWVHGDFSYDIASYGRCTISASDSSVFIVEGKLSIDAPSCKFTVMGSGNFGIRLGKYDSLTGTTSGGGFYVKTINDSSVGMTLSNIKVVKNRGDEEATYTNEDFKDFADIEVDSYTALTLTAGSQVNNIVAAKDSSRIHIENSGIINQIDMTGMSYLGLNSTPQIEILNYNKIEQAGASDNASVLLPYWARGRRNSYDIADTVKENFDYDDDSVKNFQVNTSIVECAGSVRGLTAGVKYKYNGTGDDPASEATDTIFSAASRREAKETITTVNSTVFNYIYFFNNDITTSGSSITYVERTGEGSYIVSLYGNLMASDSSTESVEKRLDEYFEGEGRAYSSEKIKSLTLRTYNTSEITEEDFDYIRTDETRLKGLQTLNLSAANLEGAMIPEKALYGKETLANLTLPITSISIGPEAFVNTSIHFITISDNIISMGRYTEDGNVKYKPVFLPYDRNGNSPAYDGYVFITWNSGISVPASVMGGMDADYNMVFMSKSLLNTFRVSYPAYLMKSYELYDGVFDNTIFYKLVSTSSLRIIYYHGIADNNMIENSYSINKIEYDTVAIGDSAFRYSIYRLNNDTSKDDNEKYIMLDFPANCKTVGDYAFYEGRFSEIDFKNISSFGSYSFYCTKMKEVKTRSTSGSTFDGITYMGDYAFYGAVIGTEIDISSVAESLEDFEAKCVKSSVTAETGFPYSYTKDGSTVFYRYNGGTFDMSGDYEAPQHAFNNMKVFGTVVKIGGGKILYGTEKSGLYSNQCCIFAGSVFYGCYLDLRDAGYIGDGVFSDCLCPGAANSLSQYCIVDIRNVRQINGAAFENNNIYTVYAGIAADLYDNQNDVDYSGSSRNCFYVATSDTAVFGGSDIKNIDLSGWLPKETDDYMTGLFSASESKTYENVLIHDMKSTRLPGYLFRETDENEDLTINNLSIEADGDFAIGQYCFSNTVINNYALRSTGLSVEEHAFEGAVLNSFNQRNTIDNTDKHKLLAVGDYAFRNAEIYESAEKQYIEFDLSETSELGCGAFYHTKGLVGKVVVGPKVTALKTGTFDSTEITSLELQGVTTLKDGGNAASGIDNCRQLVRLIAPKLLDFTPKIYNCTSLTEIYLGENDTDPGNYVGVSSMFETNPDTKNFHLYVPTSKLLTYFRTALPDAYKSQVVITGIGAYAEGDNQADYTYNGVEIGHYILQENGDSTYRIVGINTPYAAEDVVTSKIHYYRGGVNSQNPQYGTNASMNIPSDQISVGGVNVSVTGIDLGAMRYTDFASGIKITFGEGITHYGYDGYFDTFDSTVKNTNLDYRVVKNNSVVEALNLPDNSVIGAYAFQGLTLPQLQTLKMGDNCTVSDYAFQNCKFEGLKSVTTGDGCDIGDYVFQNATLTVLSSVTFGDHCAVGDRVFEGCTAPVFKTLKAGADTSFGQYCFKGNKTLTSVTFGAGVTLGNWCFYQADLHLVADDSGTMDWSNVTSIGENCFSEAILPAFVVMNGITTIPAYAFYSGSIKTLVSFEGTNVTKVCDWAFEYQSNLERVIIPKLSYMGAGFYQCNKLHELYIGHLTYRNASYSCSPVFICECGEYDSGNTYVPYNYNNWSYITYCTDECTHNSWRAIFTGNTDPIELKGYNYYKYSADSVLEIPLYLGYEDSEGNVTILGCNSSSISDTTLDFSTLTDKDGNKTNANGKPYKVIGIGDRAFRNTTFTNVTINLGNNCVTVGDYAFDAESNAKTIASFQAPVLESIGSYAFRNVSVTGAFYAPACTDIGNDAFRAAKLLGETTLDPENIGSYSFYSATIAGTAIADTLQWNRLKTIGNNCFEGAALPKFVIMNQLTKLSYMAFRNTNIVSFEGTEVTEAEEYACSRAKSLEKIVIPKVSILQNCVLDATDKLHEAYIGHCTTCGNNNINSYTVYYICGDTLELEPKAYQAITSYRVFYCISECTYTTNNVIYTGNKDPYDLKGYNYYKYDSTCVLEMPCYVGYKDGNGNVIIVGCNSSAISSSELDLSTVTDKNGVSYNVSGIGDRAFRYTKLTGAEVDTGIGVVLSSVCTSIGDYAFYADSGFTKSFTNFTAKNVTTIGAYAFYKNGFSGNFTADKLESIGNYAFWQATAAKDFYAPKCAYIGEYAFYQAQLTGSTKIDPISIGQYCFYKATIADTPDANTLKWNRLTAITGEYCFYYANLPQFVIMNSITSIPARAFEGCTGMVSFEAAELLNAGGAAFFNISSLERVKTPKLNFVGASCFQLCNNVHEFYVGHNTSPNNFGHFSFGSAYLIVYECGTENDGSAYVTTGGSVIYCADGITHNNDGTQTVRTGTNDPLNLIGFNYYKYNSSCVLEIPLYVGYMDGDNVRLVGCNSSAISNMTLDLSEVTDKSGTRHTVIDIGYKAFYNTAIDSVEIKIGTGVTAIGDYAFSGESKAKKFAGFTFTDSSVTTLGACCFSKSDLSKVVTSTNTLDWSHITSIGAYCFNGATLPVYVIMNGLTSVADSVFREAKITYFEGRNVTELCAGAFYGTTLEKIVIPNCGIFNDSCLRNSSKLHEVYAGHVTYGGNEWKSGTALVIWYECGTVLGSGNYANMGGIASATYCADVCTHNTRRIINTGESDPLNLIGYNYYKYDSTCVLEIPMYCGYKNSDGTVTIAGCNSSSITASSLNISKVTDSSAVGFDVKAIGNNAFRYTNLSNISVTIGDKCTSIGEYAFSYDQGFTKDFVSFKALGTKTIGKYAFYKAAFSDVLALDPVTIGQSAFESARIVSTDATEANTLKWNKLTSIGESAFKSTTLPEFIVMNSLESVAANAFYGSNFVSFEGESVKSIGTYSFIYMSTLERVYIPQCSDLGYRSLYGVSKLHELYIGHLTNQDAQGGSVCAIYVCGVTPEYDASYYKSMWGVRILYCSDACTYNNANNAPTIFTGNCNPQTVYTSSYVTGTLNGYNYYKYDSTCSLEIPHYIGYEDSDGNVTIVGCNDALISDTSFSISEVTDKNGNKHTVVGVGSRAFLYTEMSSTTTLTLPDSVTSVGSYAFGNQFGKAFTTVNVLGNATISANAFDNVATIKTLVLSGDITLETNAFPKLSGANVIVTSQNGYVIPSTGAFGNNTNNTLSVNAEALQLYRDVAPWNLIPLDSISTYTQYIKDGNIIYYVEYDSEMGYAYISYVSGDASGASNKLTIPASATISGVGTKNIGRFNTYAVCDVLNFNFIALPATLEEIVVDTAYLPSDFMGFSIDSSNNYFDTVDGVLYSDGKTELICYPSGKTETSFTVPEEVRYIGSHAFDGCTKLEHIYILSNNVVILDYAFANCSDTVDLLFEYSGSVVPSSLNVTFTGKHTFSNVFTYTVRYAYGSKSDFHAYTNTSILKHVSDAAVQHTYPQ